MSESPYTKAANFAVQIIRANILKLTQECAEDYRKAYNRLLVSPWYVQTYEDLIKRHEEVIKALHKNFDDAKLSQNSDTNKAAPQSRSQKKRQAKGIKKAQAKAALNEAEAKASSSLSEEVKESDSDEREQQVDDPEDADELTGQLRNGIVIVKYSNCQPGGVKHYGNVHEISTFQAAQLMRCYVGKRMTVTKDSGLEKCDLPALLAIILFCYPVHQSFCRKFSITSKDLTEALRKLVHFRNYATHDTEFVYDLSGEMKQSQMKSAFQDFRNIATVFKFPKLSLDKLNAFEQLDFTFDLPQACVAYTGREKLTNTIYQRLTSAMPDHDENTKLLVTALCGLGGVGKTQLAIYLAARYARNYPNCHVAWLLGDKFSSLVSSMREICLALGIRLEEQSDDKKVIDSFCRYFHQQEKWLLLVDNVNSFDLFNNNNNNNNNNNKPTNNNHGFDIFKHLPKMGGHVLMTTRASTLVPPDHAVDIQCIPIDSFERGESVEYLTRQSTKNHRLHVLSIQGQKASGAQEKRAYHQLALTLNDYPLALAQAATYICLHPTITIDSYCEKLSVKVSVYSQKGQPQEYSANLWTTWDITMTDADMPHSARDFLNLISFFAPDRIPVTLLERYCSNKLGINDVEEEMEGVTKLAQSSMVSYDDRNNAEEAGRRIRVHRLVQLVTKDKLDAPTKDHYLTEAMRTLAECWGAFDDTSEGFNGQKQLQSHLETVVDPQKDLWSSNEARTANVYLADCLAALGSIYVYILCNGPQSQLYLEAAIKIYQGLQDSSYDGKRGRATYDLSNAVGVQGKAQKKIDYLTEAEAICNARQNYDERARNMEKATIYSSMSNAYCNLKNTAEQMRLALLTIQLIEANDPDPEHKALGLPLTSMGNALNDLNRWAEAREYLDRALKIKRKHLGEKHLEVARTLTSLGNSLLNLGESESMMRCFLDAYEIKKNYFGPDHVQVARHEVSLGTAYGSLNPPQWAKQVELQENALERIKEHYTSMHLEVAKTLGCLAVAYGHLGQYAKQEEALERSLSICQTIFETTPRHVDIAHAHRDLAIFHAIQEDFVKALSHAEAALDIYRDEVNRKIWAAKAEELEKMMKGWNPK